MKYILVTGGVISGLGKGIISSSVGVVLQAHGIRIVPIKIDPYLNIDAGTFSPIEHGEVFVLNDGGEVDLDLGNYERFLGVKLNKDNNITTGKIYMDVIGRERQGAFLGRTVQVIPHVTDAIQDWILRVSQTPVDDSGLPPQVCIIELGGTVGDIESMPFVEAFRQFQFRVKRENFINVHVSLVPEPLATGEQKTKPTQHCIRDLRGQGLYPELVICRCQSPLQPSAKSKIAMFCHVDEEQVISVHDVSNTFQIPSMLSDQRVFEFLFKRLNLNNPRFDVKLLNEWQILSRLYEEHFEPVKIALVGKYMELRDAYVSVYKALQHAAVACKRTIVPLVVNAEYLEHAEMVGDGRRRYDETVALLRDCHGVLVPGGFGERGIEGKVAACKWARENRRPLLGICLGMQCLVIEFARNVLQLDRANSTEFDKTTPHPVVMDMPEHNLGQMGGTMRVGLRTTTFDQAANVEPINYTSLVQKLYGGVSKIQERHRHRYEVNASYAQSLQEAGLVFTGRDENGERLEICELINHPFYVGVQFHPEYLSNPLMPSPPYVGLILASIHQLDNSNSAQSLPFKYPLKAIDRHLCVKRLSSSSVKNALEVYTNGT